MKVIITEKAITAIATFLECGDYNILEKSWSCVGNSIDFITKSNDGDLVFVECNIRGHDGNMFSDGDFNRDSLKRVALACLATNPEVSDCAIRLTSCQCSSSTNSEPSFATTSTQ